MIKWTNHIIYWHTFHPPFQVLIYLDSNNLRQAFLEATSVFQIPPNSTRQTLAQAKEARWSHVEEFLTARLRLAISWAHSLPVFVSCLPPQSLLRATSP